MISEGRRGVTVDLPCLGACKGEVHGTSMVTPLLQSPHCQNHGENCGICATSLDSVTCGGYHHNCLEVEVAIFMSTLLDAAEAEEGNGKERSPKVSPDRQAISWACSEELYDCHHLMGRYPKSTFFVKTLRRLRIRRSPYFFWNKVGGNVFGALSNRWKSGTGTS